MTTRHRIFIAVTFLATTLLGVLINRPFTLVRAAGQANQPEESRGLKQALPTAKPQPSGQPVVVELFTSEGCSSCPPADALLAELDRNHPIPQADIIVLGEHVDYWDSIGWRDRFSSPEVTARQRLYQGDFHLDDIYTPQVVLNGHLQFLGSDRDGIYRGIEKAATDKVFPLQISNVSAHDNNVTFSLAAGPPLPQDVNVFAALVDPSDTTEIHAGENSGRTLHHAGVVRRMSLIGTSLQLPTLDEHPFTFQANLSGVPATLNGMRLVVFAQIRPIGPILSVVTCTLGSQNYGPRIVQSTPVANRCPAPTI